ncbi:MAG TPA: nitronate monooxygenase family protein [Verrucomicrobiae bacterium]|jgi:nitronate monooxygenase|nr:nitronate monooxygenase family protein [Verrucomicrobiae bacterium]
MALPPLFKNLRLPVVGAPMFIVSGPELVIAQCKAGIVGSMPALNARPSAQFDEWLGRIRDELSAWDRANPDKPAAPYAVNLIVHGTNARLDEDLDIVAKHKAPIVITSLGARDDVNGRVHAYGGFVFHDVTTTPFARKAIDKGADGLVLVAAGAGGHAGRVSPFALVEETRAWFDGPIALSGAIASGRGIRAAQAMGADLAYIGSAFITAKEADATREYKDTIIEAVAGDIVYTDFFSGIPGNYLRQTIERHGYDPANLPKREEGVHVTDGVKAWRDIWAAGQGVGAVRAVESVDVMIERWRTEMSR